MLETMRQRFVRVVDDLVETDDRTVVVLAVISRSLFDEAGTSRRHPSRVIDVGIREQAQIGVAGGLALEGFRPILTGYAPFLVERPFEQIKLSLGHQGVHATIASVGGSWDAAGSGRTHQAPEDVALMSTLPDIDVHVPGHPDELELLLRRAHVQDTSAYIRMSGDMNSRPLVTQPGRVVTLRRASEAAPTVLAVGPIADDVLAAVEGLDVTVLYTATPNPLDVRGLRASILGTDVLIVEPYLSGTSVHGVVNALAGRPIRLRSHGVVRSDLRRYGTPSEHRKAHGLDAAGIRSFIVGASGQRAS